MTDAGVTASRRLDGVTRLVYWQIKDPTGSLAILIISLLLAPSPLGNQPIRVSPAVQHHGPIATQVQQQLGNMPTHVAVRFFESVKDVVYKPP